MLNAPQTWAWNQDAGNAQAQLILIAIASFADVKTGEAWPSRERLAEMSKCTARTITTYLRTLEEADLITCAVRTRDNGSQTSNLIVLNGYAEWAEALRNGGHVAKPRRVEKTNEMWGENLSTPVDKIDSEQSSLSTPPGKLLSTPPGKQASTPELPLNKQINLERERAGDKGARSPLETEYRITESDVQWGDWLRWLNAKDRGDLSQAAKEAGEITVYGSKWPKESSRLPMIEIAAAGLTDLSRRMSGEVVE